ncbi:hypothetical protein BD626DRAFT_510776 [Schizophyllum amplum]|uniref:DUF1776-domain-containing protein n=1 Tax=Schizophyllum amplum TaxID=97359 RepID=A0A550C1I0_9AGAR|nr:hypothetical protein BD626DRAFT_510776 [Auriculariopsis ampla]
MDKLYRVEEYLQYVEVKLHTAWNDLPDVRDAVDRLWQDVSRYGPQLPKNVHLPGLGDFEVPAPPPPPPPPPSWSERTIGWAERHPYQAAGTAAAVVCGGLMVGYGPAYVRSVKARRRLEATQERRQVVVVLGADTPYGLPLVQELNGKNFIVIASTSTAEAADALTRKYAGYVRGLVLDPTDPATVPVFLRSLSSTLTRRFPITAHGDPFARSTSHPYIQSVISLLTIPSSPVHAPLEHVDMRGEYLQHLSATQIVPLEIIQALLPLMRDGPPTKTKKSIVVCLPAIDARVGLPFSSVQGIIVSSTHRAVDILRREVRIAALTGKADTMGNIRVVTAEIGQFDVGVRDAEPSAAETYKTLEAWTPSEKVVYGPGFIGLSHPSAAPVRMRRKSSDVSAFVGRVVSVVTGGRYGPVVFGFNIGLGYLVNWLRGDQFSVGAGGEHTILDTLLNLPYYLIAIRNALLPAQPFVIPPSNVEEMPLAPAPATVHRQVASDESSGNERSEAGSDADVESNNSGDASGASVDHSWISLNTSHGDA